VFNSKKDLILVDYQDSYFYNQRRNKRRNKWFKLLALILLLIGAVLVVSRAQSNTLDAEKTTSLENPLIHGPQLLFNPPNPAQRVALPIDIKANIEINGLIAFAEVKQVFVNPYPIELEGKYQFPLPENAAVQHLKVKVGDKTIVGQIMEKQAAKAVYKKAKLKGKKASLVEQQRPNLFTNKIANIPGQSTLVVTLKFIMPVAFADGHFNLRLPLAMTKRYQPKQYQRSPAHQSTEFIAPVKKVVAWSQASINIKLNAGVPVTSITSNSHKITSTAIGNNQSEYLITLSKSQTLADKSFELNWQLMASQGPQISSFTEQVDGEYFTLLSFLPPQSGAVTAMARDIIFIIDTSGSMQGNSMAQAKSSLQQALLQLTEKDSFNIIAFDNDLDLLFPSTQMVSNSKINQAQAFISDLAADGGTEIYRPLSRALAMGKSDDQSSQAIRQIVFITDGAVSNEFELMQLLNGAQGSFRLYTLGIGAAPNGYFMKKAAQFGRGKYVFIQHSNEVESKISELMATISQPAVSNIRLTFDPQVHQQLDIYPRRIPDLYLGDPMQVAIRSKVPIKNVQVQGDTASTPWYHQLILDGRQSSPGVSTLWARRKIEDLLDSLVTGADKGQVKDSVIATSIKHQIISPYTSFIAVEKRPKAEPLLAGNRNASARGGMNRLAQAHESLMVAMPQTSLDWQQELLFGVLLIVLAILTTRIWSLRHARLVD